jgi:hypothetical protein
LPVPFSFLYSNKRLGIKRIFASPAGVQDKVYILGRDGVMVVISSGPEFNILTKNTLGDKFDASPVIVGNEIYLRGHQYLYCISDIVSPAMENRVIIGT